MLGIREALGLSSGPFSLRLRQAPLTRTQPRSSSSRPLFSVPRGLHARSPSLPQGPASPCYTMNSVERSTLKHVTLHPSAWHVEVLHSVGEMNKGPYLEPTYV